MKISRKKKSEKREKTGRKEEEEEKEKEERGRNQGNRGVSCYCTVITYESYHVNKSKIPTVDHGK